MNVVELFARHEPGSTAFVCGSERLTYGALAERVALARANFVELLPRGGTIAVVGDNSIAFAETVLAALSAGLPIMPLHPRYPRAEINRAIELATPKLIVSTDDSAASLAGGIDIDHVRASTLFEASDAAAVAPVELEPDDPALLMFTSGTAGSPRVAVLSHRNVAASIQQSIQSASDLLGPHQTILGVMPLTHVLGIVSVVAVAVTAGATIVLTSDTDVVSIAETVRSEQVTLLVAPPVFWYRLAHSDIDASALASVTATLSGAAPLSSSVAELVEQRFGLRLFQGYGLTEASPGLTSAIGTDAPPTSVGRPLPGVRLRLVDEEGDDVLIGDVGELWASGDNVFSGYLGDPEATAAVVDADGWLHTGDLAVVDESGFLYIVGRSKDQIIVSGFNVHPGEVEDRLVEHHSVEAAAVVGDPDPEYGEIVVAYVVEAPGTEADPDVLEAHCRTRLSGYKVPSRFEIVSELPTGLTGKVRRRVLRG